MDSYDPLRPLIVPSCFNNEKRLNPLGTDETEREAALEYLVKKTVDHPQMDRFIAYLAMDYFDQFATENKVVPGGMAKMMRTKCLFEACKKMKYEEMVNAMKAEAAAARRDGNKMEQAVQLRTEELVKSTVNLNPITPFAFIEHLLELIPRLNFVGKKYLYALIVQSKRDIRNCNEKPSVIAAAAILVYVDLYIDPKTKALDEFLQTFVEMQEMNKAHILRTMTRLQGLVSYCTNDVDGHDIVRLRTKDEGTHKSHGRLGKKLMGAFHGGSSSSSTKEKEDEKLGHLGFKLYW